MYEVPLGARGQDPYAEALEFAVASVAGGLARLERVNTAFVDAKRCNSMWGYFPFSSSTLQSDLI